MGNSTSSLAAVGMVVLLGSGWAQADGVELAGGERADLTTDEERGPGLDGVSGLEAGRGGEELFQRKGRHLVVQSGDRVSDGRQLQEEADRSWRKAAVARAQVAEQLAEEENEASERGEQWTTSGGVRSR